MPPIDHHCVLIDHHHQGTSQVPLHCVLIDPPQVVGLTHVRRVRPPDECQAVKWLGPATGLCKSFKMTRLHGVGQDTQSGCVKICVKIKRCFCTCLMIAINFATRQVLLHAASGPLLDIGHYHSASMVSKTGPVVCGFQLVISNLNANNVFIVISIIQLTYLKQIGQAALHCSKRKSQAYLLLR